MASVEYPHLQGEASKHRGGESVTHFVVSGQDGRRVGLFVRGELAAFKSRITHGVKHQGLRGEVFRVQPVDGAGRVAGDSEEWTPPQAA